ncbi:MAG: hypothetical protein CL927_12770 [Deltaproteobacteria bacterium]|nr:hypothetical protein [Deltaproteobacteria bacterium]HCH63739.1 hypothetical protein [Deltaproteobacteria bacterium]
MTGPPSQSDVPEDFDSEDTDGAARFEHATRAAQALSELPEVPPEPSPSDLQASSPTAPLQANRVTLLMAVMFLSWLGFMVWDTWG